MVRQPIWLVWLILLEQYLKKYIYIMTKNELKKLIKEVVKETMAEMLMELKLENIIEGAMSKMTISAPSRNLNETTEQVVSKPKPKTDLKKKLGISDEEWNKIYSSVDTGNSILSENRNDPISSQPKPPEVSANDLAEARII